MSQPSRSLDTSLSCKKMTSSLTTEKLDSPNSGIWQQENHSTSCPPDSLLPQNHVSPLQRLPLHCGSRMWQPQGKLELVQGERKGEWKEEKAERSSG